MGSWNVDADSQPGILRLKLEGKLSHEEMAAFVDAHNAAIDRYGTRDYKVWCDISELSPLSQEAAALFERAKQYSASHENFRGSAVYASSATVALQHRRTSIEGGVMATELISDDVRALEEHLRAVYRVAGTTRGEGSALTRLNARAPRTTAGAAVATAPPITTPPITTPPRR